MELHRLADKFSIEADLLDQMLWRWRYHDNGRSSEALDLILSQAKRVRRESTLLVRALAAHRDHLQRLEDAQGELT